MQLCVAEKQQYPTSQVPCEGGTTQLHIYEVSKWLLAPLKTTAPDLPVGPLHRGSGVLSPAIKVLSNLKQHIIQSWQNFTPYAFPFMSPCQHLILHNPTQWYI